MSSRKYKVISDFEEAVQKRALASKDGQFSPHDKEIADILYTAAKNALIEHLRSQERLIGQLTRSAH